MNLPPPPVDPRASLGARLKSWLNPLKPPPGWAGVPARIIGFFVRIPATAYLAVLIFVVLASIVVVSWMRFHAGPEHAAWEFSFGWLLLGGGLLVAAIVPYLVLRAIALWRAPVVSDFEALDRDWRAGLVALQREGIDVRASPVFLVLGSLPRLRERSLMESGDRGVKLIGADDGPIVWYAGRDVLYLSLRHVGVAGELSKVAAREEGRAGELQSLGRFEPAARDLETDRVRHRQLAFVCRRLTGRRRPVCAVNGVLVVAGFSRVLSDPDLDRTAAAIRSDLLTIQRETGVRAPVVLLVDGLEAVRGFDELIRRLGRDRTARQRFGHRFAVAASAYRGDLERLTDHVCGAFEEWVHILFREQRVLERTGNGPLYALVSRVRLQLADRLGQLLANGFGFDPEYEHTDDSLPFSGCYVSGTNAANDRWAFAQGVLDKQLQEQELVEWSRAARRRLRWRRLGWRAALALNAVLVLTLAGMLVARFTNVGRLFGLAS